MPEVSRFYGITIQIYYGDHPPAHFHAIYAGQVAKIAIESDEVIDGMLAPRALGLVRDWTALRHQELREAFARAAAFQVPGKIAPLE